VEYQPEAHKPIRPYRSVELPLIDYTDELGFKPYWVLRAAHLSSGLGGQASGIVGMHSFVSTKKHRLPEKKANFFRVAFWKFRAIFAF
jgi:hypothetical protein